MPRLLSKHSRKNTERTALYLSASLYWDIASHVIFRASLSRSSSFRSIGVVFPKSALNLKRFRHWPPVMPRAAIQCCLMLQKELMVLAFLASSGLKKWSLDEFCAIQIIRVSIQSWRSAILPAECLILFFVPSKSLLEMLWIKIRPIFVPDIKICINRLCREKAAQSASPAPAHNQIQTRNFS